MNGKKSCEVMDEKSRKVIGKKSVEGNSWATPLKGCEACSGKY